MIRNTHGYFMGKFPNKGLTIQDGVTYERGEEIVQFIGKFPKNF